MRDDICCAPVVPKPAEAHDRYMIIISFAAVARGTRGDGREDFVNSFVYIANREG